MRGHGGGQFNEILAIVIIGVVVMFGAVLVTADGPTRINIAMMIAGSGITLVGSAAGRWTERRDQGSRDRKTDPHDVAIDATKQQP